VRGVAARLQGWLAPGHPSEVAPGSGRATPAPAMVPATAAFMPIGARRQQQAMLQVLSTS
jgi:hypothetical protein